MTKYQGSCHCQAVIFEVESDFKKTVRCDCSLCKRKGTVINLIETEEFNLLKGKENITLYEWNTKVAKHYFCKICGIYTHHKRRSADAMGVNVGCFDHLALDDLEKIGKVEGSSLTLIEKRK